MFHEPETPMRPTLPKYLLRSIVRILPLLTLAASSFLTPGSAQGQLRERGPILLDLPASTRALSMGDAFALGFRDSDVVFYQPGYLSRAQGFSGSIQWFGASALATSLSAAGDWFSGGVALGIRHLTYGAPGTEPLAGEDLTSLPADPGSLRNDGVVGTAETVVSAGYGRSVLGVRVGAVGKLVAQRFGSLKATTGAVDLGAALSPGPVSMGLALRNLGREMEIGGRKIPLPLALDLGATTERAWVGPLDLAASGAIRYREGGELIPSIGLEVAYWPVTGRTFAARIGYRELPSGHTGKPLTFGAGFQGDDLVLEYAFQAFEEGDPSHRFTIGWR